MKCNCKNPLIVGVVMPFGITITTVVIGILLHIISVKRSDFDSYKFLTFLGLILLGPVVHFSFHFAGFILAVFAKYLLGCESSCKSGIIVNATLMLSIILGYFLIYVFFPADFFRGSRW
jgi:hypothetical protein